MNNGIFLVWLIILLFSFIRRAVRRNVNASNTPEGMRTQQTSGSFVPQTKKPIRVSAADAGANRMPGRILTKQKDASCESQFGHVHPERNANMMRFGGRPDLEPGYMYLNGVKVLIKEADRLEFLK